MTLSYPSINFIKYVLSYRYNQDNDIFITANVHLTNQLGISIYSIETI